MSHSTTLPELPGTIASRREHLKRSVVMGAAIPVLGSLLAACGGDAEHPTAGALSITDGAVEWSVRSPDEAYRTVIGASDDIGPFEASGTAQTRSITAYQRGLDLARQQLDEADWQAAWTEGQRLPIDDLAAEMLMERAPSTS
ncbi:MAG TPA: hypothetical protein VMM78_03150 [Thermomicrobiales bacterium]|nr:hypothetical protein [Thermomicrobiales bacterium]